MERVLVTGATGLIGRHVCTSLVQRGFDVHGVARNAAAMPGVNLHACDLLDTDDAGRVIRGIRPQIVVHCAWVTTHGAFWQSPQNLDWLAASARLLRTAHDCGVRRVVGLGTGAEYAADSDSALNETHSPIGPTTLYGTAKDAFRRVAEQFALSARFEFAWARVFMLYGAGEHPDRFVASLARALVAGQTARMSSGRVVRDFLDARDVGAAIASVAASDLTGPINIGSGAGNSLRDVGMKLAELAGRPDLLAPGAIADRPGEPLHIVPDIGRLTNELGFRPAITLERGLSDVLDYWRARQRP